MWQSLQAPLSRKRTLGLWAGSIAAALLAACGPVNGDPNRILGLSTSLPILWSQDGDIRGELSASGSRHWAADALATHGRVTPLDTLANSAGVVGLPSVAVLILAQPRPLMAQENVALDKWVRGGGRLLLFADPMLTVPSHLPLGDPRGPQWSAMLSPILNHWGLELTFDPDQAMDDTTVPFAGERLTVRASGRFVPKGNPPCSFHADGIVVECSIGKGRVLAVADAALFDDGASHDLKMLGALISRVSQ